MPTLVMSDMHWPFEHRKALQFCADTYAAWDCDKVICTGDAVDHHNISRHLSETDAMSANQEVAKVKKCVALWSSVFPDIDFVLGNHDLIPYRQAKELGIPKCYMRELQEVYEMPGGWKFYKKIVHDKVLYLHTGGSGKIAASNKAREQSMSVVCGHTHRHGGVIYSSNPLKLFFGLNAGCLIDKNSYAMRYFDGEPTIGCGVVCSPEEAYFIPMKM